MVTIEDFIRALHPPKTGDYAFIITPKKKLSGFIVEVPSSPLKNLSKYRSLSYQGCVWIRIKRDETGKEINESFFVEVSRLKFIHDAWLYFTDDLR
jgi:hypothetical protein